MEQIVSEAIQVPELEPELPRAHRRFYDHLRQSISGSIGRRNAIAGKTADLLLLVPDMFMLLCRLSMDGRVALKYKLLLAGALVYFISPFDLLPEALLGPIGYLDDLVLAAYVVNKILQETDPSILRQHWGGTGDLLETVKRVLDTADTMVDSRVVEKLKKMIRVYPGRHTGGGPT